MANAALDLWRANRSVYGADKLATAMRKAGYDVGRDQVARLMSIVGIEGVRRGKHTTVTTICDPKAARHPDLIRRSWSTPTRPDKWWVADFTYVWTLEGFVYTSFVTDVCSRRILGWRVSASKATPLVMSALEQALFTRRRHDARFTPKGLVHHSDAGSQGGITWSSQHLKMEVVGDGCQQASAGGPDDAWPDVVAGTALDRASRGSGAVLAGDRPRAVERGRRGRGGRVPGGRVEVVPLGWRDVPDHVGSAIGPLPVLRRAGRDRDPARAAYWGASDRPTGGSVAVDDLAGAAPQRLHSHVSPRVPGVDGAVARGAACQPPEGRQARRERCVARVRA
jgi:putative transposase